MQRPSILAVIFLSVIGSHGVLAQIDPPPRFLYADDVASTGGRFGDLAGYAPTNLMNDGFTNPDDTIDTTSTYTAVNNNYATSNQTTGNFNLTFEFPSPVEVDGMHVWNFIYRTSGGAGSGAGGVNNFTLTFYNGPGATGTPIGSVFSGSLAQAAFGGQASAESVYFANPYPNVRSVVMHVISNHGASFTGMSELAFNGGSAVVSPKIDSFTASAPFIQRPDTPTLHWSVSGDISSLSISPDVGDVTALTTGGSGNIAVSPLGEQVYTLTLNGSIQQQVSVVGLPTKEKLHLYLFIGQSNMQGAGGGFNATLDAPHPRVLKFGSRNGMEKQFVTGSHNLTQLGTTNNGVGMGVEFGKTILAAHDDPEVVVVVINHAIGSSAIQWWAPGVIDNKQVNPLTGQNHYLYDEAVQRVEDASEYGVLKGVLWHQGEYNANNNTNPDSDPAGYAARLQALVDNLRQSFSNPSLPFICGKFVPSSWVDAQGQTQTFTGLPHRATVEAAIADLPNHRTNTFCVDNNGLRGNDSDRIHFDAFSQRLLGQRYAAAVIDLRSDPYRHHIAGYYTPQEMQDPLLTDPGADNDHDGHSNYLEYAFLTNPAESEAVIAYRQTTVAVEGEGNFPAISFRQRLDTEAPDYLVEVSENLATWRSNGDGGPAVTASVGLPVANGDGTSTATVRHLAPLASTPLFFRVRVQDP